MYLVVCLINKEDNMREKGVSLIALIITIIVIIILSAIVLSNLNNGDVIGKANQATFKQNASKYRTELEVKVTLEYEDANAPDPDINVTGSAMKTYIKSLQNEDIDKFEIRHNKLVYVGSDEIEKTWITELGMDVAGNGDTTAPTIIISEVSKTTSTITVEAVASDDAGGSGVNQSSYQYSNDNGTTWSTATSQTEYTFSSLVSGTYPIKARVSDNAGNIGTSSTLTSSTASIGDITISASTTNWTSGSVTITISYPVAVTSKKYSTDNGSTWNDYTSPLSISTNNTKIIAKGSDGAGNQATQEEYTVSNIDKLAPDYTIEWNVSNGTYLQGEVLSLTITASDSQSGLDESTISLANLTINSGSVVFSNRTITKTSSSTWRVDLTIGSGSELGISLQAIYGAAMKDNVGNTAQSKSALSNPINIDANPIIPD
jgi:Tfp pilus assembly protein PilE